MTQNIPNKPHYVTPIFDLDWMALPLWEEHHRTLATRLEEWIRTNGEAVTAAASAPPDEAARRIVALLSAGGWLEIATGFQGDRYAPDFRAICLCRLAFAHLEDLCDFSFAIQALAAYPLTAASTAGRFTVELKDLRYGDAIGAFALSEPGAGSDLGAITTVAVPDDDCYRISGTKTWIGNAGIADQICVLARTGGPGAFGLSLFLVPGDAVGLTQSGGLTLSAPRAFGSIVMADCAVPVDALLGEPGLGLVYALDTLDRFRLTVGAAAIGFARRALQAALCYVRERKVDGQPLASTQMTLAALADMATELNAAQLLVLQAAWETDTGRACSAARSAMAKYHATEAAQSIVDRALQLHGASGCVAGSIPEKLYRQIRALRIYEGTSEVQQLVIGRAVSAGQIG
ncbi:acyl-CoA dehydrogenase [Undibacterium sp. GrIS 1.2]